MLVTLVSLVVELSAGQGVGGIYFFQVLSPAKLAYTYEVRLARDFGRDFAVLHEGVELVRAEPEDACESLSNSGAAVGAVVLAERGGCSFLSKTRMVEETGALATIVTDSAKGDDGMVEMIGDESGRSAGIPALYLPGNHGQIFQSHFKYSQDRVFLNIPLNLSLVPLDKVKKPPWELW